MKPKPPEILNRIADVVLAYRPKARQKAPRKRKPRKAKPKEKEVRELNA